MASILLVEDDEIVRDMLVTMLVEEKHKVRAVENGVAAYNELFSYAPDVMITDIIMPQKSGIGLIKEVREQFPHISIIAISGGGRDGPESYLKGALKEGAAYIFSKPVRQEELLEAIQKLSATVQQKAE